MDRAELSEMPRSSEGPPQMRAIFSLFFTFFANEITGSLYLFCVFCKLFLLFFYNFVYFLRDFKFFVGFDDENRGACVSVDGAVDAFAGGLVFACVQF